MCIISKSDPANSFALTPKGGKPVPALPAASLLLLRDVETEIEVLMLKRHHKMRFATGAVVFPGGKVEAADRSEVLRERCEGAAEHDSESLALRIAAIRETFEESGVLLAREESGAALGAGHSDALVSARRELNAGDGDFAALLRERGWVLACDALVAYAHWITPEMMPKRFDTHFFLARAPEQEASHDGSESVDSFWIGRRDAMRDAESGARPIMFPQLRNVEKLLHAADTADALTRASAAPIVTVLPRVVETEKGRMLRIPEAAGYDVSEIPFVPPKPAPR